MKTKEDLRIVYLGTPDFAVETLRRLVENGYNVVGVVTTPDKPVGRHQNHLQPSPVKSYALEHGLPLMQPERLRDEAFLEQLRAFRADLQVVVAFRMLPEVVWNMPPMGTVNLHASLLPRYRGAAPINWAIMNGESETGATTFLLKHDIDTGDMLQQINIPISETDTFGTLHDRLMTEGADLMMQTIDALLEGNITPTPQDEKEAANAPAAPKIFRETCRIDWNRGLTAVYNHIRGLSPVPAAWTMLRTSDSEAMLKIYGATPIACNHNYPVGKIVLPQPGELAVATEGGLLRIDDLQIAGKKRMTTADYLRGCKNMAEASVD